MKTTALILSVLLTHTVVRADIEPALTESSNKSSWLHVYSLKKDVPDAILNADPRSKDIKPNAIYEVTIGLVNDNLSGNDETGDDRGFTYGHYLKASRLNSKGIRFAFEYSEDLYSKNTGFNMERADGLIDVEQVTNAEKIMKFVLTNREQGRLMYYRVGIGWQQMDPSGKGLAADLQQQFHEMVGFVKQIVNVDNGGPTNAVLVESAVGYQVKHTFNDSAVTVEGNTELGLRYSGLENGSFLMSQQSASLMYKPNNIGAKLTLGVDTKIHSLGSEYNPFAEASLILGKKTSCGIRVTQPMGTAMNYQQYNLPNFRSGELDKIWSATCTRKF